MKKLLLLFLGLSATGFAQKKQGQALLDSLLGQAQHIPDDTGGVKLLDAISLGYHRINPNEGLKWAARELSLAHRLGWRKGEATAYNNLGANYENKGLSPQALDAYFKALRINEAIGNKLGIGIVCNNIGNVYRQQKHYPAALEYGFKALRIYDDLGDKARIQLALGNLANVYSDQGNIRQALAYQVRGLHLAEELRDKQGIITQTENIGVSYSELKQYAASLPYSFKALRISEEIGDKQSIAINLGNIGETYVDLAGGSPAPEPDSLVAAGRHGNLVKGIDYLKQGLAASRDAQFYEAVPDFSEYLSKALAMLGDYKGALDAYEEYKAAKDSLFSLGNTEQIHNLETKRAVELKDKDIRIARLAVLKKQNERMFFIAGILTLLVMTGILLRSFRRQRHTNILLSKEKQRSDDLLRNILPEQVAEELKDSGASAARQYEEVSVLFTDFVDFTGAAQQLSPQALVKELHECFTAFDAIIDRHGLEKIKTIGDAYMAVCGLPNEQPDHALRAVRAALEILDFIQARSRDAISRVSAFEIRIGINSGPVVAGIVGVRKFAYDIWGDAVNMAARMEQCGVAGRINVSETTYLLVKDACDCEYRGEIAAKNKGPVAMYFVEALLPEPA